MTEYDVIVIGAGPAGLAAACAAKANGADRVLLLERDARVGGILNQCIHDGFGLIHYGSTLTGPEYAARAARQARQANIETVTGAMVLALSADRVVTAASPRGLLSCRGGAVVLATGCRERTRGAIAIPGTRPAGVFTAGVVQRLMNVDNISVGRRVVILGAGDIGLIMARRLALEGAEVVCVLEMLPSPGGLARNIRQCLYDYGIPLYTGHTVTRILGDLRLTGVEVSRVDASGRPEDAPCMQIPCDTLVLSVGLIPENEIAKSAGVSLDARTNGVVTDAFLESSVPGVFACGNARSVMDLADFVSEQGAAAGANAAAFSLGRAPAVRWDDRSSRLPKGLPEEGITTCVLCPNGCALRRSPDGSVTGNRCERGAAYARQEAEQPQRTLTLTMRTGSGALLPVRSSRPIPRELLKAAARRLNGVTLPERTYACGDVLLSPLPGTDADVLAAAAYQPREDSVDA